MTLGLPETLRRIKHTVEMALSELPENIHVQQKDRSLPLELPIFSALSLGMAGLDRKSDIQAITPGLAKLFSLDPQDELRCSIGNDASLLSVSMLADKSLKSGIAVIAGKPLSYN